MSRTFSKEKRQQWKDHILKQRESGLSIVCWCRQNNILSQAFYYWQRKLFPKPILDRSDFTEVEDGKSSEAFDLKGTGITIEYHGIIIHLEKQFDHLTLKQCLTALKEAAC